MNPSQSIIKKIHSLICSKVKNGLDNLFEDKRFNIHENQIVYTFKESYMYEDAYTSELFFEQDLKSDCEYIVYNIQSVIKNIEFKESYYDLDIIHSRCDNKYIDFIYKPSPIYIENVNKLNDRILQEYLETYNLFKNIRICNHNNNYNHRLSFSINGRLYNRPDREYYIVMNDNYNFNIQVYKLDPKNKREKMIFGIWMNVTSCNKNVISEPFFL
jgi:hypothetical protein